LGLRLRSANDVRWLSEVEAPHDNPKAQKDVADAARPPHLFGLYRHISIIRMTA